MGGIQKTKSLAFISSDLKHNYHAVHHFTGKALSHPRGVRTWSLAECCNGLMDTRHNISKKDPSPDITNISSDNGNDDVYNEPVSLFQVCIPENQLKDLWCWAVTDRHIQDGAPVEGLDSRGLGPNAFY